VPVTTAIGAVVARVSGTEGAPALSGVRARLAR